MSTPWQPPPCQDHLSWLLAGAGRSLEGGAELAVYAPDGTLTEVVALARHHRLQPPEEPGGLPTLWIRPIIGGTRDHSGAPLFSIEACRRRGITYQQAARHGDELEFHLGSGQVLRVRPAQHDRLEQLQLWDAFFYTRLTGDEEAQLEELVEDSWYGRYY